MMTEEEAFDIIQFNLKDIQDGLNAIGQSHLSDITKYSTINCNTVFANFLMKTNP
jgi:hypothetical protein